MVAIELQSRSLKCLWEGIKLYGSTGNHLYNGYMLFLSKIIKKTLNSECAKEPKYSSVTPESANWPKDQAAALEPSGRENRSPEPAETAKDLEGASNPAERGDDLAGPKPVEGASDSAAAPEPMEGATDPAATPERIIAAVNTLEDGSEPMEISKEPAGAAPELPGVSFRDSERWAEESGPVLWMKYGSSSLLKG